MSDWQPIETAPKDLPILVPSDYQINGVRLATTAYWDNDEYAKAPRPFWRTTDRRTILEMRRKPPTHWMPLPVPPQEGGQ